MEREAARLGGLLGGLCAAAACWAQPGVWFVGLGDLPGGDTYSAATTVSASGEFVAGCSSGAAGFEAFVWSPLGGMRRLGDLPGGEFDSCAFGVANDGRTVVGEASGPGGGLAFRWTLRGGMSVLPFLSSGVDGPTLAFGVTPDGGVIVGEFEPVTGQTTAFRWTPTTMTALGDLPGGADSSTARAVSADGLTVVGWSGSTLGTEAFLWREPAAAVDGGMIGLGELPGGKSGSSAWGVSPEGGVVVGASISDVADPEAFRWSASTRMLGLGDLPGGLADSLAHGASQSGHVIVGRGSTDLGVAAFVWTPAAGMRSLRDVLVNVHGLKLAGWQLTIAYGVSADGRTIVGLGTHNGAPEAWIARIPPYCAADCNTDGALTNSDFACFQTRFVQGDLLYADCNEDGELTISDWACQVGRFVAGCPHP